MGTATAYSKKAFIKCMDKELTDQDIVYVSGYIKKVEVKKSGRGRGAVKVKEITIQFPADAFKQQEGVKDLLQMFTFVVAAGEKEKFSQETIDIVEYQDKHWNVKTEEK